MVVQVGVLALQGAFLEHQEVLHRLGVEANQVRLPEELEGLQGLIIPGGESTTIGKLLKEYHLDEAIKDRVGGGMAIFATCAGLILLARKAGGLPFPSLELMDIEVQRNAYGRQVDSFEADIEVPALPDGTFHAIFIRAPVINRVEPEVEVVARLGDDVVAARQGKLLVTTFHPELTRDLRFHAYFLNALARA